MQTTIAKIRTTCFQMQFPRLKPIFTERTLRSLDQPMRRSPSTKKRAIHRFNVVFLQATRPFIRVRNSSYVCPAEFGFVFRHALVYDEVALREGSKNTSSSDFVSDRVLFENERTFHYSDDYNRWLMLEHVDQVASLAPRHQ